MPTDTTLATMSGMKLHDGFESCDYQHNQKHCFLHVSDSDCKLKKDHSDRRLFIFGGKASVHTNHVVFVWIHMDYNMSRIELYYLHV